jgi:hypothetical protein
MKPTQADVLVGCAQDVRLFFDPALDAAFASLGVGEHTETWALRSKAFRRWLVNQYMLGEEKPPGAQAVSDAVGALEASRSSRGIPTTRPPCAWPAMTRRSTSTSPTIDGRRSGSPGRAGRFSGSAR